MLLTSLIPQPNPKNPETSSSFFSQKVMGLAKQLHLSPGAVVSFPPLQTLRHSTSHGPKHVHTETDSVSC